MEVQNCRLFLHRYLFLINALYNVLNSRKTLLLNCTWNNVPRLQYFNLAHRFTCTSLHQVSRNITGKASSTHNCCPQNLYNLFSYNSLDQVPYDFKLYSVGSFFILRWFNKLITGSRLQRVKKMEYILSCCWSY